MYYQTDNTLCDVLTTGILMYYQTDNTLHTKSLAEDNYDTASSSYYSTNNG